MNLEMSEQAVYPHYNNVYSAATAQLLDCQIMWA